MARSEVRAVRTERQPHRDAVVRLREAYRRLRLVSQQPSARSAQTEEAAETANNVQEVSA